MTCLENREFMLWSGSRTYLGTKLMGLETHRSRVEKPGAAGHLSHNKYRNLSTLSSVIVDAAQILIREKSTQFLFFFFGSRENKVKVLGIALHEKPLFI